MSAAQLARSALSRSSRFQGIMPPGSQPPLTTGQRRRERLGRRRWVIERTISWLTGYRRLSPRYERHPRNYLAFLVLAAALCCYKRYLKLTM
ncbi:transposase [Streptomyces griseoflavus]|uniref:transposase n=1 Tax=Streptomyces griseoflavus TaxID=35619 RepID=UPI003D76F82D